MILAMFAAGGQTAGTADESAESGRRNGGAGGRIRGSGSGDVIRIGVFEPLTGQNAAGGEYELRGVELANEQYPTVLGKNVELVIVDNKSDTVEAATAAARLVEEDVDVVLGSWGAALPCRAAQFLRRRESPQSASPAPAPT